jgi:cerevisin
LATTVASSNINDQVTSSSNYGTCTKIIAPGSAITSAYIGSNTATAVLSGTSMATPQVAGMAAYLGTLLGIVDPTQLQNSILGFALSGAITSVPAGTPNLLLQNNISQ